MSVSFDLRRRLGHGYFGEVWLAVDTGLNFEVALKKILPERIVNQKNFYQEAQALKAAEHSNIVNVYDTGTFNDGIVYISMEFLHRGSLENQAAGAPLPLSRAKRLMIDVLRGLQHAHSAGILHRDIKPANIMIGNNGEGKLSDFGLALPDSSSIDMSYVKQYQYMLHLAPEVASPADYSFLSDIYACGATLYRMVNGDATLPRIPIREAVMLARDGRFPPRNGYRDYVPPALKRLINRSLNPTPHLRFQSAEDMRHALEQQAVFVDWVESLTENSVCWNGTDDIGLNYYIEKRFENSGGWSIETMKGRSFPLRRVGKYCYSGLNNRVTADRLCRNLLQSYVNGSA